MVVDAACAAITPAERMGVLAAWSIAEACGSRAFARCALCEKLTGVAMWPFKRFKIAWVGGYYVAVHLQCLTGITRYNAGAVS